MRKFLNHVDHLVDEMIDGYVAAHRDRVTRGPHPRVVVRAQRKPEGIVGLAIGNGSGHEPIAMGWVGRGLLDANAVGDVFAAPPPEVALAAIAAADHGAGVLLLVSRHTGDVLNGRMAAELARVAGHDVVVLEMGDDVASTPPERRHERRGGPGTTFAYKVLGAAAEEGMGLRDLAALGQLLLSGTSTLAVTLGGGISPLTGARTTEVPEGRAMVGSGVHGDGGSFEIELTSADDVVGHVVATLLDDQPFEAGDEVLVLVNGFGATTLGELLVSYRCVDRLLGERGLQPFRPLVGTFVTTQDTAGLSVSLARTDAEVRRLWAAPCDAPFFPHP
ncbi:MAG: dihydroxyacetone kinase subunit DhaK [Acidimicrobiia bacterium]